MDEAASDDGGVPVDRLVRYNGHAESPGPPSLHSRFHVAVERTRASKDISAAAARETSTKDKLLLYAYYKQARLGPCTRPKPRKWEVIKRAKWEAWRGLANMPREEAMQRYITMLLSVVSKLPENNEIAAFTQQVTEQPNPVPDLDRATAAVAPLANPIQDDGCTADDSSPEPVTVRVTDADAAEAATIGADREMQTMSAIRRTIRHRSAKRRTMQPANDFEALFTRVSGRISSGDSVTDTEPRHVSLVKRLFSSQDENTAPELAQNSPRRSSRPSSVWVPGAAATVEVNLLRRPPADDGHAASAPPHEGAARAARANAASAVLAPQKSSVSPERHRQLLSLSRGAPSGTSGTETGESYSSLASESSALSSEEGASSDGHRRRRRRRRLLPKPPGKSRVAAKQRAELAPPSSRSVSVPSEGALGVANGGRSAPLAPPCAEGKVELEEVPKTASGGEVNDAVRRSPTAAPHDDDAARAVGAVATMAVADSAPPSPTPATGSATEIPGASPSSAAQFRIRSHREYYLDELQRHSAVVGTDTDAAGDGSPAGEAKSKAHLAGLRAAAAVVDVDVEHLSTLVSLGTRPPPTVATALAKLTYLDVSFGQLESLAVLEFFPLLDTVVADHNSVASIANMPRLGQLTTLSLNRNRVRDLALFLRDIREKLPALAFLSLLGNPCCPVDATDGRGSRKYTMYCEMVAAFVPALTFLDSHSISPEDRGKALANAATTDKLAARFGSAGGEMEAVAAAAAVEPQGATGRSVRGARRRHSTRRALWGNGEVPEQDRVRSLLSQRELSTDDPLLQLAQEKVSDGLLSSNEYLHIATVHRAVSGNYTGEGDGYASDDSLDDNDGNDGRDASGRLREDTAGSVSQPRGGFFSGLLESGYRLMRSTRSADPPSDAPTTVAAAIPRKEAGVLTAKGAATSPRVPVQPLVLEADPAAAVLMNSAVAKLKAGIITQVEYDHIVRVHSKLTTESPLPDTGHDDPPTPQGRCAAVRLSRRDQKRPQLYAATLDRNARGEVALATKVTADDHVVVALADPRTRVSVGDRILAVDDTTVDPDGIIRLLATGSGPVKLDLLRAED